MKTNEIFTLNLEFGEVDDLQDIMLDKVKKDYKFLIATQNNAQKHFMDALTLRDSIGIYCKVAEIIAEVESKAEVNELEG